MSDNRSENIIIAVPKGRILEELIPLMKKANILPEKSFFDNKDRRLLFSSNIPWLKIIRAPNAIRAINIEPNYVEKIKNNPNRTIVGERIPE